MDKNEALSYLMLLLHTEYKKISTITSVLLKPKGVVSRLPTFNVADHVKTADFNILHRYCNL